MTSRTGCAVDRDAARRPPRRPPARPGIRARRRRLGLGTSPRVLRDRRARAPDRAGGQSDRSRAEGGTMVLATHGAPLPRASHWWSWSGCRRPAPRCSRRRRCPLRRPTASNPDLAPRADEAAYANPGPYAAGVTTVQLESRPQGRDLVPGDQGVGRRPARPTRTTSRTSSPRSSASSSAAGVDPTFTTTAYRGLPVADGGPFPGALQPRVPRLPPPVDVPHRAPGHVGLRRRLARLPRAGPPGPAG